MIPLDGTITPGIEDVHGNLYDWSYEDARVNPDIGMTGGQRYPQLMSDKRGYESTHSHS